MLASVCVCVCVVCVCVCARARARARDRHIGPLILILEALSRGFNFLSWALYPYRIPVPIVKEAEWTPEPTGLILEKENLLLLSRFKHQTIQPTRRHYDDYATLATHTLQITFHIHSNALNISH